MLGRLQRTTRLDAGLALAFAGLSYLVWALVAGITRWVVQELTNYVDYNDAVLHNKIELTGVTRAVHVLFLNSGFVIDVAGVVWMAITLLLVVQASRQKISVSWAWASAICQGFVAALGAVIVCAAAYLPHVLSPEKMELHTNIGRKVSQISLQVIMPIGLLIWVLFLVWLLVERARLNRRGPTLRDGMRSNIFK